VNARSALFDLYGDHLRARDGRAPIAALVRLLAPLDIASPAVRTAVSRMVRQGWLEPVRLAAGPGYALTRRGARRLEDAAERVYGSARLEWDQHWHVIVVGRPASRAVRARLRDGLGYLGYAPLDDTTWVAPRPSSELDDLLESAGVRADRFRAQLDGDGVGLVRRAWDLDGLARSYDRWLSEARELVATAPADCDDEQAFATRSQLVHEWRKFLFRDPGLPRCLLPPDWPGERAGAFFDEQARRLMPAASRFVDTMLSLNSTGARP
jgi:phenylacetic acid degradation operon negative regulatory protein